MWLEFIYSLLGIAGISFCKNLEELTKNTNIKYELIILEARDRIGGRMWTKEISNIPIDLGATWLEGRNQNPLFKFVKENNFEYFPQEDEEEEVYYQNNTINDRIIDIFRAKFDDILENSFDLKLKKDKSLKESMKEYIKKNKIKLNELETKLLGFLEKQYEIYNGCKISELSSKYYVEGTGYSGESVTLKKGYGYLCEIYGKELKPLFLHVVKGIDYSNDQVKVITNQGDIYGDYVICTIPIGCLKKEIIEFNPKLPSEKLEAIAKIGVGVLDKVILEFPKVFWNPKVSWIENLIDRGIDDFRSFHILNPLNSESKFLIGFVGADFAKNLEQKSDKEIVTLMMNALKNIFGNNIPDPISHYITRWYNDPFSYGSYSFYSVDNQQNYYTILGNPIKNKLFFAGEATIKKGSSFVNGAILSGIREAERIFNLLKETK